MALDILTGLLIFVYGFFGYWYGITGIIINLAGIVAAGLACLIHGPAVSLQLGSRFGLSTVVSYPLAAALLFLLVTRSFYLVHVLVKRRLEGEKSGPHLFLAFDRAIGLSYGAAKGCVVVLGISWILPLVMGPLRFESSRVVPMTRSAVAGMARLGAGALFESEDVCRVISRAISDPRTWSRYAHDIATHPGIDALIADSEFAERVRSGNLSLALGGSAFKSFIEDESIQADLKELGFNPERDDRVTREQVGQAIIHVQGRASAAVAQIGATIKSDTWKDFLSEPAVRAFVDQGVDRGSLFQVLQTPTLARVLGLADPRGASTVPGTGRETSLSVGLLAVPGTRGS